MDLLLEENENEEYIFKIYPAEESTTYKDKNGSYRSIEVIPYLEINVYAFMKRKDDCDKFIKN